MSALYAALETSISRRSSLASSRRFTSLSPSCTSRIAVGGLAGLKTRELAREIGCANGAVYNLVVDMDELILRVGSRTLRRLDALLTEAESEGSVSAGEPIPDWAIDEQMALFRHIYRPLATLFPKRSAHELGVTARSLFSAVHGMVMLGLEQKLIAVPIDDLRNEIAIMARAMVNGLALEPQLTSPR
jgi:AcrR family transcriptional regulator